MSDREQFEAWAKGEELNLMRADNMHCEDGVFDWDYYWSETESSWKSWQAARATPAQPDADVLIQQLALERDHARASLNHAVKNLSRIHMVIYPLLHTVDGVTYRFAAPDPHEYLQALADRIRAIPDEVAALAEQVQGQQWVSVKDRLPEPMPGRKFSENVLVINMNSSYPNVTISELNFFESENVWRGGHYTHWMPLPAAPSIAQDGQKSEVQ